MLKCVAVDLKPTLSDCKTMIYDGRRIVAQSDCSAEDVDPLPVWMSTASPTRIQVSYRADFTADNTPRVNYVQNSPVPLGITLATFSLRFHGGTSKSKLLTLLPVKRIIIIVVVVVVVIIIIIYFARNSNRNRNKMR